MNEECDKCGVLLQNCQCNPPDPLEMGPSENELTDLALKGCDHGGFICRCARDTARLAFLAGASAQRKRDAENLGNERLKSRIMGVQDGVDAANSSIRAYVENIETDVADLLRVAPEICKPLLLGIQANVTAIAQNIESQKGVE